MPPTLHTQEPDEDLVRIATKAQKGEVLTKSDTYYWNAFSQELQEEAKVIAKYQLKKSAPTTPDRPTSAKKVFTPSATAQLTSPNIVDRRKKKAELIRQRSRSRSPARRRTGASSKRRKTSVSKITTIHDFSSKDVDDEGDRMSEEEPEEGPEDNADEKDNSEDPDFSGADIEPTPPPKLSDEEKSATKKFLERVVEYFADPLNESIFETPFVLLNANADQNQGGVLVSLKDHLLLSPTKYAGYYVVYVDLNVQPDDEDRYKTSDIKWWKYEDIKERIPRTMRKCSDFDEQDLKDCKTNVFNKLKGHGLPVETHGIPWWNFIRKAVAPGSTKKRGSRAKGPCYLCYHNPKTHGTRNNWSFEDCPYNSDRVPEKNSKRWKQMKAWQQSQRVQSRKGGKKRKVRVFSQSKGSKLKIPKFDPNIMTHTGLKAHEFATLLDCEDDDTIIEFGQKTALNVVKNFISGINHYFGKDYIIVNKKKVKTQVQETLE